jgi:cell division protein FtsX
MSILVKQDGNRSQLQQQIAAELQEKAKRRSEEAELPDHVADSRYIEHTTRTTNLGWVWIVVIAIIIAVAIFLIINKGF